jgi:hypothetical protein
MGMKASMTKGSPLLVVMLDGLKVCKRSMLDCTMGKTKKC